MNKASISIILFVAFVANFKMCFGAKVIKDSLGNKYYLISGTGKDSIYTNRDSILNRYLFDGAFLYPFNTLGWNKHLDSALSIMPDDGYLWQQKSMPYFKERKYIIGLQYLDSAVKYDENKWIDYRAFMNTIFVKDYPKAIMDFRKAQTLNPNGVIMDHSYNFYIGLCNLQLNKYNNASQFFFDSDIVNTTQNYGQHSVHFLDYFYLGICCMESGELNMNRDSIDLAINYLDKSLKIYPIFSDAMFYKARCLIDIGQFQKAMHLLQEADSNFVNGYTINEDNSKHEKYPYQISLDQMETYINWCHKFQKG